MVKQYIPLNFRLYLFLYRNKLIVILLLIISLLIIKFDLACLILATEPQQDFDYLAYFPEEDEPDEQDAGSVHSVHLSFDSTSSSDDDFDNPVLDKYQHRLRVARIHQLIENSNDNYDTLRFVQNLVDIIKKGYGENNTLDPFSGNYAENSPYTPTASFLHKCVFFFACVLLSIILGGLFQGYLFPLGYSMNLIAYKIATHQALSEIEHNKEGIFMLFNMLHDCGLIFYDGEFPGDQ